MLKFKFSSRVSPRYLVFVLSVTCFPLILKFKCLVITLAFGLKIIMSVLLVFSAILLALSQKEIFLRSKFIFLLISLRDLLIKRILVSSAK